MKRTAIQLFTNHQQLTAKSAETKTDDKQESNQQHVLYIAILIVIIAAAVILYLDNGKAQKERPMPAEGLTNETGAYAFSPLFFCEFFNLFLIYTLRNFS